MKIWRITKEPKSLMRSITENTQVKRRDWTGFWNPSHFFSKNNGINHKTRHKVFKITNLQAWPQHKDKNCGAIVRAFTLFPCIVNTTQMSHVNDNANPCIDLDEILPAHSYLSKEGFGASLNPNPSPSWTRGAWNSKTWRTKMFSRLHIYPGSAGHLS